MMIELPSGTLFDGRYEIVDLIGEGGMGRVYKAIEVELGRPVALKLIHHELLNESDSSNRFRQEGTVLSRLQHSSIVSMYRFGVWQERLAYIAMELVAGQSLRTLIDSKGYLSSTQTALLGKQICAAMEHAHSLSIVHRDLKPGNILLDGEPENERIKIIDFGLARIICDTSTTKQQLTQTGMLVGSVNYMSPEQCMGRKADARSDVYALGCVLYECLTGQPPFQSDNPIGLMSLHVNERMVALQKARRTVENAKMWDEVLGRALHKDPAQRYQSMDEFAREIDALLGGNWSGPGLVTAPVENKRRMIPLLLPVSIVVCALLVVAGFSLRDKQEKVSRVEQAPRVNKRSVSATVLTPDWISDYRRRREKIEGRERIPLLKDWLKKFAGANPEGASIANAWLCLETAGRAYDVQYTNVSHTMTYNVPPRAQLSAESEVFRKIALSGLRAAVEQCKSSASTPAKGLLRYYIAILEMLDQTDNQRVVTCSQLRTQKDLPTRYASELRSELKRIYRRSGDFPAEEKLLRLEIGEQSESSLRLVDNLAHQKKDSEARKRLQDELNDLLNDNWTYFAKIRVHYFAHLLYCYGMIPQAWKVIEFCQKETNNTSLRLDYDPSYRTCRDENVHCLLRAKLFAAENKKSEACAALRKIDLVYSGDRNNLLPAVAILAAQTGEQPEPIVERALVRNLEPAEIEWMARLSEAFRPTREALADKLDAGALKLIQSDLEGVGSTTEGLKSLTQRLLAAKRFNDAEELLNLATKFFQRKEQREALNIVSLLRIRSQVAQGDYDHAWKELEKLLQILKAPDGPCSEECLADALALKAAIARTCHRDVEARANYAATLRIVDRSYDLSAGHKAKILTAYAGFCDEIGDKASAKAAREKCERLEPARLKDLREFSLF